MLVRIETPTDDDAIPSRNVLARGIRDHVLQCFGDAAAGAAYDTHARWCDPGTRLALIRVPREFYPMVRASVTLLTQLVVVSTYQPNNNNKNATTTPTNITRLALHVLSVHGSARTAKLQALRRVQKLYRDRILLVTRRLGDKRPPSSDASNGPTRRRSMKQRPITTTIVTKKDDQHDDETVKLCRAMQETLEQIAAIDF